MEKIEEQYQKIITTYPNAYPVDNVISHMAIPLVNNVLLDIEFNRYPNKPKVKLIKPDGQVYKKSDEMSPTLKNWQKKDPIPVIQIIIEIIDFIENFQSFKIGIKKEFLDGLLALCRDQHPREIIGLLKAENNVVTEFILPPGAQTSSVAGVFSPQRLPLDPKYAGSVHSHPSGNSNPSLGDLNGVFKKFKFNFIVAYPYNNISCVKCYDRDGKDLQFDIIE